MKNVLIINGSPRKDGNTEKLLSWFKKGCIESENKIVEYDVYSMNIKPCIACMQGGESLDNPCKQDDDMKEIYKSFLWSDIVCFASPVFFWSVSSPVKAVIDRLYALKECDEKLSMPKKDVLLLMTAGGGRMDPVVSWYESMTQYLGWNNIGSIICKKVLNPGDIEGKDELREAYEFGKSI